MERNEQTLEIFAGEIDKNMMNQRIDKKEKENGSQVSQFEEPRDSWWRCSRGRHGVGEDKETEIDRPVWDISQTSGDGQLRPGWGCICKPVGRS